MCPERKLSVCFGTRVAAELFAFESFIPETLKLPFGLSLMSGGDVPTTEKML